MGGETHAGRLPVWNSPESKCVMRKVHKSGGCNKGCDAEHLSARKKPKASVWLEAAAAGGHGQTIPESSFSAQAQAIATATVAAGKSNDLLHHVDVRPTRF